MFEEVTEIEFGGLVHSPQEWLTFAHNLNTMGQSNSALILYRSLYEWAKENDDFQLQEDCRIASNTIIIPRATTYKYNTNGATDPHNRPRLVWKRDPEIDIFDFKLDEGRIIEALQKIEFKELKGRRYWFVVHRVFNELNWLSVTKDNKFAGWVNFYYRWEWEQDRPWRTVEKVIRDTDSWLWNENTVPGNDIGKYYAAFAKLLWSTFTDKPKRNENDIPDDKQYFYLPNMKKINNGK